MRSNIQCLAKIHGIYRENRLSENGELSIQSDREMEKQFQSEAHLSSNDKLSRKKETRLLSYSRQNKILCRED